MAKKKFGLEEVKVDEFETAFQAAKTLLAKCDEGATVAVGDILSCLKGVVGEYENILPRESATYLEGDPRQLALVKTHTTFTFVAPKGIKHQDKVEWAYKSLRELATRVSDITGGDILIEPILPPSFR